MKKTYLVVSFLLLTMQYVSGQIVNDVNPANVFDPRVILVNPAGVDPLAAPYIVVGYQRLYIELADKLSNRLFGAVYPTRRYGAFAVTAPRFQATMLSQGSLEFRYAYRLARLRTSFGVNLGTMSTSYNTREFKLTSLYDPLLLQGQSLNAFNLGFGMVSQPAKGLFVAVAADHVNRPTMSFQGGMKKSVRLQAGLVYANFPVKSVMLRPMGMVERDEGETYFSLGGEVWPREKRSVVLMGRFFYTSERLSAGFGMLYNNLRFDLLWQYNRDVSSFAGSSLQAVLSYRFPERKCDPPVAVVKALKDTLHLYQSPNDHKSRLNNGIEFVSGNEFYLDGRWYEILNPQANPYLNYVFFKKDSSFVKNSMRQDLDVFYKWNEEIAKLDGAIIRVTGLVNRSESCQGGGMCEKDTTLALKRAESVADYLRKKPSWSGKVQINDNKKDSNKKRLFDSCIKFEPLLRKERQRADIEVVDKTGKRLMLPVVPEASDFICTFDLSRSQAPCGWKSWLLGVWRMQDGRPKKVWSEEGSGAPPPQVKWDWRGELSESWICDRTYFYKLQVVDQRNDTVNSDIGSFVIRRTPREKRFLILYLFDRADMVLGSTPYNPVASPPDTIQKETGAPAFRNGISTQQTGFDSLVVERLDSLAYLIQKGFMRIEEIKGFTDTIGESGYNRELSWGRVLTVVDSLRNRLGAGWHPFYDGVGEYELLVPEKRPADHWINRRVEIRVRYTPEKACGEDR